MRSPLIMNNSHNLDRFIKAQDKVYQQVITELRNDRKTSHTKSCLDSMSMYSKSLGLMIVISLLLV